MRRPDLACQFSPPYQRLVNEAWFPEMGTISGQVFGDCRAGPLTGGGGDAVLYMRTRLLELLTGCIFEITGRKGGYAHAWALPARTQVTLETAGRAPSPAACSFLSSERARARATAVGLGMLFSTTTEPRGRGKRSQCCPSKSLGSPGSTLACVRPAESRGDLGFGYRLLSQCFSPNAHGKHGGGSVSD